jgi:RNA polymerase sigma factor (TIGR02999 family)
VASSTGHDVTLLLHAWAAGDSDARERALSLVYGELRRRAAAQLRRERQGHTLQPTALVHEAYIRLVGQHRTDWQNRAQFLAVASQMMRRILVDRARARHARKRGGGGAHLSLEDAAGVPAPAPGVNVLDLDAALDRLAALDPRKSRIAELRFFGGLSLEETGQVLQVSAKTVERDWQTARAWLFRELSRPEGETRDDA